MHVFHLLDNNRQESLQSCCAVILPVSAGKLTFITSGCNELY